MKITREELIFFSSIISKQNLFGNLLENDSENQNTTDVKETLSQLQKKGVINKSHLLSKVGFTILDAVKDYKDAGTHLVINHMYIAMAYNKNPVVICKTGDGQFEIFRIPREWIMLQILKTYPYLQKTRVSNEQEAGTSEDFSMEEMLRYLAENEGDVLSIGVFDAGVRKQERICVFVNEECTVWDLCDGKKENMDAGKLRELLVWLLNIGRTSKWEIAGMSFK